MLGKMAGFCGIEIVNQGSVRSRCSPLTALRYFVMGRGGVSPAGPPSADGGGDRVTHGDRAHPAGAGFR